MQQAGEPLSTLATITTTTPYIHATRYHRHHSNWQTWHPHPPYRTHVDDPRACLIRRGGAYQSVSSLSRESAGIWAFSNTCRVGLNALED